MIRSFLRLIVHVHDLPASVGTRALSTADCASNAAGSGAAPSFGGTADLMVTALHAVAGGRLGCVCHLHCCLSVTKPLLSILSPV